MEQDNARVVSEAIAAWNARDAERYVALLDEDCLVETHGESPLRGLAAARQAMQRYLDEFSDLRFELEDFAVNEGELAVATWRAHATSSPGARGPAGGPRTVYGCTVIGLKRGRLVRLGHYWDSDDGSRSGTERVRPATCPATPP